MASRLFGKENRLCKNDLAGGQGVDLGKAAQPYLRSIYAVYFVLLPTGPIAYRGRREVMREISLHQCIWRLCTVYSWRVSNKHPPAGESKGGHSEEVSYDRQALTFFPVVEDASNISSTSVISTASEVLEGFLEVSTVKMAE